MSFAQPYLLLLLIALPILVILALVAAQRKRTQWAEFVAHRLRKNLLKSGSAWPRWLGFASLLLGSLMLILSIARLQSNSSTKTESTRGRNLLIVLDLSRSMKVADLKPSRLDQAKALIYELLETLPNDRIGVIGFAGSPFLFAPLTNDHGAVRETVEQLDFDSIPNGGSDVGTAVKMAIATLKETAQSNNGMIILSDGEEHSPELLSTVNDIKKSGTYTFTIGIGTEDGGFIPDPEAADGKYRDLKGEVIISRLQSSTLQNFASQCGGRFALAQNASDIPAMITAAVSDLDTFELKGSEKMLATDLFQWFMFPAVLFLMIAIILGTRWRGLTSVNSAAKSAAVFAMMMTLLSSFSYGEEPPITLDTARAALEAKDYQAASSQFEQLARLEMPESEAYAGIMLGKATADYRLGELAEARAAYSHALAQNDPSIRSAAHQGMGNTLFQLGWQSLSKGETYPGETDGPARFEALLKERMDEWMKDDKSEAKAQSEGFRNMQSILLNWSDSVRHSQSALAINPQLTDAQQNKTVAYEYVKKLRKAMEDQQKEMQQQMGGQDQGDGEGQGKDPGDQEGEEGEGDKSGDKEGKNSKDPKDKGDQGDKDPDGKTPNGEKPDPNNTHGKDKRPEETKEQHAMRKLNENSDLQRGVTAEGTYQYRRPDKDW
jgi:Ca-activated chloride channel homolog